MWKAKVFLRFPPLAAFLLLGWRINRAWQGSEGSGESLFTLANQWWVLFTTHQPHFLLGSMKRQGHPSTWGSWAVEECAGGLHRKEMNFPLAQPKASPGLDLFNGIRPVFRSQSFSLYCLVSIQSKVFPLRGAPTCSVYLPSHLCFSLPFSCPLPPSYDIFWCRSRQEHSDPISNSSENSPKIDN